MHQSLAVPIGEAAGGEVLSAHSVVADVVWTLEEGLLDVITLAENNPLKAPATKTRVRMRVIPQRGGSPAYSDEIESNTLH